MLHLVAFTVSISAAATIAASLVAMVMLFGLHQHYRKRWRILFVLAQALNAVPPTVIGVFVYYVCIKIPAFRGIIFTPTGMIIGQFLLALPIAYVLFATPIAQTVIQLKSSLPRPTNGTQKIRFFYLVWTALLALRQNLISSMFIVFGRLMGEVGTILIIGGSIVGRTETLSTNIVLQTNMGEIESALISGVILLAIVLLTRLAVFALERRQPPDIR